MRLVYLMDSEQKITMWSVTIEENPPPPPPNNPPITNAGPDQTVNAGDTVTLDGSGSSDPDPGDFIASYSWSSSDPSITLNGAMPTFVAPNVDTDTTFAFQLVVTDTHGAESQPDTVNVLVKAPVCPTSLSSPKSSNSLSHFPFSLSPESTPIRMTSSRLGLVTPIFAPVCPPPPPPPNPHLKGSVILRTRDDRGDLPLKNVKVSLLRPGALLPIATTYTDNEGKFDIELTSKIGTSNIKIRVDLADRDRIFIVKFGKVSSNVIFIEPDVTDLSKINFQADFMFKKDFNSFIYLNGQPLKPSQAMKMEEAAIRRVDFPDLAGIYYYSNVAAEFGKKYLPNPMSFELPLIVIGYSDSPYSHRSWFFNSTPHSNIQLADDASNAFAFSPSKVNVEFAIDTLFHEFGHFFAFETAQGDGRVTTKLHPAIQKIFHQLEHGEPDCHDGYILTDSSCSLEESIGDLFAAVITDTELTDPGHSFYHANANLVLLGTNKELQKEFPLDGKYFNPIGPEFLVPWETSIFSVYHFYF